MNIKKMFKTERPVIGMIHCMPLVGFDGFLGMKAVLQKALKDLKALEKGGVDAIMIENNYDVPHKIYVDEETIACMSYITGEIMQKTKLPVGLSVLWNDYKTALAIAKVYGAKFIRVPVFVDTVRTQYGDIQGNPTDVLEYRKKIDAEDVLLFTDIHVKHAQILNTDTIVQSAYKAIKNGSDALIITGKWTADAPNMKDLELVRKKVGKFPILIGSGANSENATALLFYADGVIVGTSLKTGRKQRGNVNIKGYLETIDVQKVKKFVKKVRSSL